MLSIDKKRLESKLLETYVGYFGVSVPYLVIESLSLVFDETSEEESYSYFIKGRAGDENNAIEEIRFEIQVDPKWSTEFMQGYFFRVLETL